MENCSFSARFSEITASIPLPSSFSNSLQKLAHLDHGLAVETGQEFVSCFTQNSQQIFLITVILLFWLLGQLLAKMGGRWLVVKS